MKTNATAFEAFLLLVEYVVAVDPRASVRSRDNVVNLAQAMGHHREARGILGVISNLERAVGELCFQIEAQRKAIVDLERHWGAKVLELNLQG